MDFASMLFNTLLDKIAGVVSYGEPVKIAD